MVVTFVQSHDFKKAFLLLKRRTFTIDAQGLEDKKPPSLLNAKKNLKY